MKQNYKNSKYIVWLYDINSKEYSIIKKYLPEEHFKVLDIANDYTKFFELKNKHILEKPDVVICDIESKIDSKIIEALYNAHCGLAKISTKKIDIPLGNNFELSDDEIEIEKNKKITKMTKSELSINRIIDMCQMSNIGKLQKITNLQAAETYNNININKQLEKGNSLENISKEYLFKLANTLNNFIEFKDNYTAGHCERVATYSEALGIALGMNENQIEDLILAANLHDIGKIALPDAVITKTGKLNDLEFNLMKKHVELGTLLLPNNALGYLKDSIRAHHEKYDGTGYPDGLKGNEIPFYAQILAIADSFDAMTSQRSYNKVKSAEAAFTDLLRNSKPYGEKIDGIIEEEKVTVKSNNEIDVEIIEKKKKDLICFGIHYNPELVNKFIEVIRGSKTIMSNLNEIKKIADEIRKEALQREELEVLQNKKKHELQLVKKGDVKNG